MNGVAAGLLAGLRLVVTDARRERIASGGARPQGLLVRVVMTVAMTIAVLAALGLTVAIVLR